MKLKTLKDLERKEPHSEVVPIEKMSKLGAKFISHYEVPKGEEFVLIKELKQEAIKWIKAMKNKEPDYEKDPYEFDAANYKFNFGDEEVYLSWEEIDAIVSWIKHFFNITEEDLKDEQEKS